MSELEKWLYESLDSICLHESIVKSFVRTNDKIELLISLSWFVYNLHFDIFETIWTDMENNEYLLKLSFNGVFNCCESRNDEFSYDENDIMSIKLLDNNRMQINLEDDLYFCSLEFNFKECKWEDLGMVKKTD